MPNIYKPFSGYFSLNNTAQQLSAQCSIALGILSHLNGEFKSTGGTHKSYVNTILF